MKNILSFFLSLKTAYGLFLVLMALLLFGSLSLPNNLVFFSGIDDAPLFAWLAEAKGAGTAWWIYALVAGFALFAVNAALCTGEALLFRLSRTGLAARLAPQVVHAGVLFVMLGHFLTASMGFRMDVDLAQGETKPLAAGRAVTLLDVELEEDENGYAVDWAATLRWEEAGKAAEKAVLRPCAPLLFGGYGLYSKSVVVDKNGSSALIRVSRDPGALWALLGGVLVAAGAVLFMATRPSG